MTEFERSLVRIAERPQDLPDELIVTLEQVAWKVVPNPGRLSASLIVARIQLERAGFEAEIVTVHEGRDQRVELRARRRSVLTPAH